MKLIFALLICELLISCTFINQSSDFRSTLSEQEKVRFPISTTPPIYPAQAANNNITGYVVLEFSIDNTGRPENISVIESNPNKIFDRSAIITVQKWEYVPPNQTPYLDEGERIRTKITFELE